MIQRNILPTNPNKKIKLNVYYNRFKTSNLVINTDSPASSIWVLQKTKFIYQFKCPLGDYISENNNIYVRLTSSAVLRWLTTCLSDTSSINQHLKKKKEKKQRFCSTTLEQQNNKQKLQIHKVLHIRNKHPKLNRINFESTANVLKYL